MIARVPAIAVTCRDAVGSAAPRERALAAHFAYVETILDRILVAGPLKDDGGALVGSLLILATEDEAEARQIIETDPYFAAGVWAEIRYDLFIPAAGRWLGGTIW
jgi:uncharacterized protein YciI